MGHKILRKKCHKNIFDKFNHFNHRFPLRDDCLLKPSMNRLSLSIASQFNSLSYHLRSMHQLATFKRQLHSYILDT